jgi:predicted adenylyl cyclase CyaB
MSLGDGVSGQHLLAELKASCSDLLAVRDRLRQRGTHEATLRQVDTYFSAPSGRLKLREVTGHPAQLIYYERPDLTAVKSSKVYVVGVEHGPALLALLTAALGVHARVTKTREIWRWEGAQVHLDVVDGLGTFVEFEEIIEEPGAREEAMNHVRGLMAELGIHPNDLVGPSYGDLTGSMK